MKINLRIFSFVTMVILSLLIVKCKKDDGNGEAQLPAITTDNVTNIWQTTATTACKFLLISLLTDSIYCGNAAEARK